MKKTDPQQGAGCGNCRCFKDETQAEDEIRWGYCRRYPPRVVSTDEGEGEGIWPVTVPENWCAEWKAGNS